MHLQREYKQFLKRINRGRKHRVISSEECAAKRTRWQKSIGLRINCALSVSLTNYISLFVAIAWGTLYLYLSWEVGEVNPREAVKRQTFDAQSATWAWGQVLLNCSNCTLNRCLNARTLEARDDHMVVKSLESNSLLPRRQWIGWMLSVLAEVDFWSCSCHDVATTSTYVNSDCLVRVAVEQVWMVAVR